MAKQKLGKCGCRRRIVSNMVQRINGNCGGRGDGNGLNAQMQCLPGEPTVLNLMAPLIFDEIGINLCTTIEAGIDISAEYPTAVSASAKVLEMTYDYGVGGVSITPITGYPSCYSVTLTNITVALAVTLYDAQGRVLTTLFPSVVYLPSLVTAPAYDEETNPTSVELEIFAPYGVSYDATAPAGSEAFVLNNLGLTSENNFIRQGLNLYGMAKILNLDVEVDTITIGLSLILQSLYFIGYQVASEGRINTPKGSLLMPDDSSCRRFVAGDLLELAIKPLELGTSWNDETFEAVASQNICNEEDMLSLPNLN